MSRKPANCSEWVRAVSGSISGIYFGSGKIGIERHKRPTKICNRGRTILGIGACRKREIGVVTGLQKADNTGKDVLQNG